MALSSVRQTFQPKRPPKALELSSNAPAPSAKPPKITNRSFQIEPVRTNRLGHLG
jgi:hypothetical protein